MNLSTEGGNCCWVVDVDLQQVLRVVVDVVVDVDVVFVVVDDADVVVDVVNALCCSVYMPVEEKIVVVVDVVEAVVFDEIVVVVEIVGVDEGVVVMVVVVEIVEIVMFNKRIDTSAIIDSSRGDSSGGSSAVPALFGSHVAAVAARMAETLVAVAATEGLLARVNSDVFLEVMLEFEGFGALRTLELSQFLAFLVRDEVALEAVDVGEGLGTHLAGLCAHGGGCVEALVAGI